MRNFTGKPLSAYIELLAENALGAGSNPAQLPIDALSRSPVDTLLVHHGIHLLTMLSNSLRIAKVVHSVLPPEYVEHGHADSTCGQATL